MSCEQWRERMLEADPAELRGRMATPLAAHIGACAACSAAARRILAGEAALDSVLAELAGGARPLVRERDGDGDAEREREARGGRLTSPARRSSRWRRALPWAVPVAMAAAVGGIWLGTRGGVPGGAAAPPVTAPSVANAPSVAQAEPPVMHARGRGVAVSSKQSYAVFATDDPKIEVVWFLSPRRGS